jgi:hypothetical protein
MRIISVEFDDERRVYIEGVLLIISKVKLD